jgi:hypothetical protein
MSELAVSTRTLEKFEIAVRINILNLRTARPADDLVATELHASSAKSLRSGLCGF